MTRSEEHTSELQSHLNLVCRLLLEKKKHIHTHTHTHNNTNTHTHNTTQTTTHSDTPPHRHLYTHPHTQHTTTHLTFLFFFNDPAPTEFYTLSLPAPLPI